MYYPVLKLSNAEMGAWQHLKSETKDLTIPIIESKIIQKSKKDEWWSVFRTLGAYLHGKLGASKFIYDFYSAFEKIGQVVELIDEDENNIVQHCMNKLNEYNLNYIPCIHFDSPEWLLDSVLSSDHNEIAIRIRCHDFNTPMEELIIERIKDKMIDKFPNKKFKLILDFYNMSANKDRVSTSVKNFSSLSYSSIILTLTNCPEDANLAPQNRFTVVTTREDLKLYRSIKSIFPDLRFGDYTVRLRPEIEDREINYYNTYLKIFYTSEDDYCIGKSTLLEYGGIETFIGVCQEIINSDVYKGDSFSHGDKAIYDCANRTLQITNHSKPIEYGINHHIELTVQQL